MESVRAEVSASFLSSVSSCCGPFDHFLSSSQVEGCAKLLRAATTDGEGMEDVTGG